jgi:hypothetical protein
MKRMWHKSAAHLHSIASPGLVSLSSLRQSSRRRARCSRIDPPGWITAVEPASIATTSPSANEKNASSGLRLRTRAPVFGSARARPSPTLPLSVHGGVLAVRHQAEHIRTLQDHDIPTIDLVVVNLYPFEAAAATSASSSRSSTSTTALSRDCTRSPSRCPAHRGSAAATVSTTPSAEIC